MEDFNSSGFDSGSSANVGSAADASVGGSTNSTGTTQGSSGNVGTTSNEQLVEIKWNGRTEKIPYSRALELAQKGYDYTQKMQQLAREREEFGSTRQRYDQAFSEVRSFLQDKQKVREYLQRLEGTAAQAGRQAAATGDPDDVVTAQLLNQKLAEAKQEITGFAESQLQAMRAQMSTEQLAGQYAQDLNAHIGGLKKMMPELRAIPRIDQILKDDVRAMGPQNIQEAKEMMIEVAKQHQKQMQQFLMEQRKNEGAQGGSVNPLRNGIEPAGGAPPLPVRDQEGKYVGGIKNPAFKQSIIAELTQLAQKG